MRKSLLPPEVLTNYDSAASGVCRYNGEKIELEIMRTIVSVIEKCMDRIEGHLANKSPMSF